MTGSSTKKLVAPLLDTKLNTVTAPSARGKDYLDQREEGKIKAANERAAADQIKADAAAQAAALANEQAALEKGQESQVQALKRKGRRASILSSPAGIPDKLGIPGTLT